MLENRTEFVPDTYASYKTKLIRQLSVLRDIS